MAHYNSFIADLRRINPGIRMGERFLVVFGTDTSVLGLVQHLQATVNNPVAMTLQQAKNRCANPNDARIGKYEPALFRLVSVWGRGVNLQYPDSAYLRDVPMNRLTDAKHNFDKVIVALNRAHQPTWDNLLKIDNIHEYNINLGPAFLSRVQIAGQSFDITSRGLLLKSGLYIPDPSQTDNGYLAQLRFSPADIQNMAGARLLDVGCGAAFFTAEMSVLHGCIADAVDFNAIHVDNAAIQNGQRRYAHGMLALKMLRDMHKLPSIMPPNSAAVVDQIIPNLDAILTHYGNNRPQQGDVFNLAAAHGGWDYTVCTSLLGYFANVQQQTDAVLSICGVTNTKVFLYSGPGLLGQLIYDQQQILAAHPTPTAHIQVIDNRTHHITL
ncbi:MAG: class I SAM-dependent methyltransferase [Methylococcales bacterium]